MELIRGKYNLRPGHRGSAVTIGNFDGLHLGHRAVLAGLTGAARERGLPAVVMSFEPTAREYFMGAAAPPRLMRFREKCQALAALGIDRLFCARFDAAMAALPPEDFIRDYLVEGLGTRYLVIGDDFRFGRDRAGNFATLQEAGRQHGFEVADTPTRTIDGLRVSSTAVRAALAAGDLGLAKRLLGRHFGMSGRVVEGDRRGRRIGFPTANLRPGRRVLPVTGVFAVLVRGLADRPWPAVANLGVRPTVGGSEPLLEVHLFEFSGDLYGRRIMVDFVARLRDERRFENLDALVAQMQRDAEQARRTLAAAGY
ncbi:bifunctional riboflavin kinase/FAD synthetase [Thioalkalivibrio sp. XN8]|uniref:bifunctional riboflavin kinase/FAD synthetase n=1 Tax=Thioalkalivibrio sp. XN8 TaxID=2712863 RepID=UPI0013ECB7C3|nr:bifunctional riboflavin kinase/FAD synthetase [Thioalkalivibrio sp. XN8]NGP52346.1 bifunctional riboflavin kinase/FAD synthetase [Thioalkalivibrio sp. XN8]